MLIKPTVIAALWCPSCVVDKAVLQYHQQTKADVSFPAPVTNHTL